MRLVSILLATMVAACGAVQAPADRHLPPTVWVVAPHPDDEVLMAAEALTTAVRTGASYEVAIVTNGDFGCARDGWARQAESIAALASLGVSEDHVHFLGYPDGWLAQLGSTPLPAVERTARDGTCGTGSSTYGARGREHADVHTARIGHAAPYTSDALVADLGALFADAPPREIHLPHGLDEHPDHAMTYAYVRRALAQLQASTLLVRHVVHAGPCWPAADAQGACVAPHPTMASTPLPPLPPPLDGLLPDRIERADPLRRRAAIAHYRSQLDGALDTSWLSSFARNTEVAWLEPIVDGEPVRANVVDDGRYLVRQQGGRVDVVCTRSGHEQVLRTLPTAHTSSTPLALRVARDRGVVVIEVHGPDGLLLQTLDPNGLVEH